MQSAVPCIAAFCKAESQLRTIDNSSREKKVELYDCNKTQKALIKEAMIKNGISCISLPDGRYIRLRESMSVKSFSVEEIIEVCDDLKPNMLSLDFVNMVSETVCHRLKLKQQRTVKNTNVIICNNKERSKGSVVSIDNTPPETKALATDIVKTNKKLSEFRKTVVEQKKQFVEDKKRAIPDVVEALKRNENMAQQIHMVDQKNGMKQTMVLKANRKEKCKPLNLKNVATIVKEAAEAARELTKDSFAFQKLFLVKLSELLNNRPVVEKMNVVLNKRNPIVKN